LRDGGYNNDWEFGHNTLMNVFECLVSAEIDFIEVGFLDQRRKFDINRSIMPDTDSIKKAFDGLDKKKSLVVAMIDYGTCNISQIKPCSENFIDGIRVIFKMHLMNEALAFCDQLKELGYKVFVQGVSFTTYNEEKMLELITLVNNIRPYAVSIVDTYGLMFKQNLFYYYEFIDKYLDKNIAIGYHAHNNFQLAFSNCIELAKLHENKERMLLLDGSVYGMGKGAGNAPTELLAMYMNEEFDAKYGVSQLLECIDVNIKELYKNFHWGYSLDFFISASNDCHPNYVSYLLEKRTLSIMAINDILQKIPNEAKLAYNKSYIEQLYIEYQTNCINNDDYISLAVAFANKPILLIGPGYSIISEKKVIDDFIELNKPIIISTNFVPENMDINYLFITNSKRYIQQATVIKQSGDKIKIIATSNISKVSGRIDYSINYESIIDKVGDIVDSSFIMLLKMLIKLQVSEVYLAGFDGFAMNTKNFYTFKRDVNLDAEQITVNNNYISKTLSILKNNMAVNFLTQTNYKI
jgi:4-hydroxy 2-oxovalerate aldolase